MCYINAEMVGWWIETYGSFASGIGTNSTLYVEFRINQDLPRHPGEDWFNFHNRVTLRRRERRIPWVLRLGARKARYRITELQNLRPDRGGGVITTVSWVARTTYTLVRIFPWSQINSKSCRWPGSWSCIVMECDIFRYNPRSAWMHVSHLIYM